MLILYVEDDLEDVDNFKYILKLVNEDIQFIHATNGKDALDLLEDCIVTPDYIFLDINMPVLNGQETLQSLQKHERHRHIPVVIYTTSNRKEDIDLFTSLGARHFVVKPNTFKEAVEGVAKVLRLN